MRSRRHSSGAPSLERYSRSGISVAARTPSQEQPAAPSATQSRRRMRSQGAPRAHIVISTARRRQPRRHAVRATAQRGSRGNCNNLAALISILRECRWSNAHRGSKNSRPATPQRRRRPTSRRWVRKSQSALYLEATPRSFMNDSASIAWMSIVFISSRSAPCAESAIVQRIWPDR